MVLLVAASRESLPTSRRSQGRGRVERRVKGPAMSQTANSAATSAANSAATSAGNLAANLLRTADRFPDRPAVRLDDTILTYADLADASARVVTLLRHLGVEPGDRVAVMLPNVPEFAVVYYGVLRAGAVVVPMNPLLKEREVGYYAEDSAARLIVAWHGCADEARMGAKRAGVPYL